MGKQTIKAKQRVTIDGKIYTLLRGSGAYDKKSATELAEYRKNNRFKESVRVLPTPQGYGVYVRKI